MLQGVVLNLHATCECKQRMNASFCTEHQSSLERPAYNASGCCDAHVLSVKYNFCSEAYSVLCSRRRCFAEIYRVLKPGGSCIMTFSNRLFYDKARLSALLQNKLHLLQRAAGIPSNL